MTPGQHRIARLRAAATKLRTAGAAAIHDGRTRWMKGKTLTSKSPVVIDDHETPTVLIETWAARYEDVQAWLEIVAPGLAEPLAAHLEQIADEAERHEAKGWGNCGTEIIDDRLMAVADVLLGGADPQPEVTS